MMKNNILYTAPAAQDTVAAVMSREPLFLSPRMTAREALARLRQVGIPQDFLTNCYVVDEEGLLLGLLTVRTLLTLPERARLDQAAEAPKAVLAPQEDQERAAALLDQLEVSELPVADGSGRLVGTFTAEDALGVLKEEATEDMERMAAIQPSERPNLLTRVLDLYPPSPEPSSPILRTPWPPRLPSPPSFPCSWTPEATAAASPRSPSSEASLWGSSGLATGGEPPGRSSRWAFCAA